MDKTKKLYYSLGIICITVSAILFVTMKRVLEVISMTQLMLILACVYVPFLIAGIYYRRNNPPTDSEKKISIISVIGALAYLCFVIFSN